MLWEEKIEAWLAAVTGVVLVVSLRSRNVTVRLPEKRGVILTGRGDIDGGDVVPGWVLPVPEAFF